MFIDDLCPISDRENIRYLSIDHLNSLNRLCHLIKSCEIVINVHLSEAIIHLQREKILIKRYQIEIKILEWQEIKDFFPEKRLFAHAVFPGVEDADEIFVFNALGQSGFYDFCDFSHVGYFGLDQEENVLDVIVLAVFKVINWEHSFNLVSLIHQINHQLNWTP